MQLRPHVPQLPNSHSGPISLSILSVPSLGPLHFVCSIEPERAWSIHASLRFGRTRTH